MEVTFIYSNNRGKYSNSGKKERDWVLITLLLFVMANFKITAQGIEVQVVETNALPNFSCRFKVKVKYNRRGEAGYYVSSVDRLKY